MATVSVPGERRSWLVRRPRSTTGFWSWVTTVDHKRIGILYGITAFAFFMIGGSEALLMRVQLAQPDQEVVSAALYNELFTMHGVTMVFLVVMPLSAAFFNYLIPLMIGARDVAFPRLNAYSYWAFLFGGLFIYSSFFLGGAPNGGWFGYAPKSVLDPTRGMTFYSLGLIITGVASTVSAINLAVTVINMRALGFIAMFVIGGLSGVTHAVVPSDYQQTDTYYIVAHFHYVLFGGAIFGLFGGIYYWWPKVFGRLLSERLGKVHFWLMTIGANVTFGPMHILGLQGMPRRIQTYPASLGLGFWNLVETIGAFCI